ncbi:helix-turn-helix domain-containing protein [Enterobacter vonholyi]|uniref:Helix-turn-helix domain-containing protein n=1 Tax=Enterobacter vonholyi TaxID=2797505 RepID=A0ABU6E7Q2_9ENTR|nr:helix-turn-helix domain-containing protein [Enterobacter vonholyi]MEB6412264.1 helix-turn-helix domain-containing protein [Enterobacter vonholyi]
MRYKDIVSDIVRWIEENKFRTLKIYEIVDKSGFSRAHINRLFKERTHMSLGTYSRMRRLSASAVALRITNEPVKTISHSFGFDSTTSFIIAFKKQFDVTPGMFRIRKFWPFEKMTARYDLLETIRHLDYRIVDDVRYKPFLTTFCLEEILDNLSEGESYSILIGRSTINSRFIDNKNVGLSYSLCSREPLSNVKAKWLSINCNLKVNELGAFQEVIYAGLLPHIGITRNKGQDMLRLNKNGNCLTICEYLIPFVKYKQKN